MKKMKRTDGTDELLAAYADGGLSPEEAAEVEALLAASPEARAELDAFRRLLAEARRAEAAAGGGAPDWDEMARAIHRACDASPPARLAWLWRPRRLAIGGLAATAAAVLLFVALRGDGGEGAPRARAAPEAPATAAAEPEAPADDDDDALPALREPEVDELSPDELADLGDELAAGDLGDDGFIADLLAAPAAGASDGAFDVFDDQPLTADELAEELPPDAIEKLDRFLAEVSAG